MSNCNLACPSPKTNVCFNAYVVSFDFEYVLDSGTPNVQHLMQFRHENPNPFIARAKAICKIRKIKLALVELDEKYQYQGVSLWLEYSVSPKCRNSKSEVKKLYLLEGEIRTREDLIQRFSGEEFLLDVMNYSFVRVDPEGSELLDYDELVDLVFDEIIELDKNFAFRSQFDHQI